MITTLGATVITVATFPRKGNSDMSHINSKPTIVTEKRIIRNGGVTRVIESKRRATIHDERGTLFGCQIKTPKELQATKPWLTRGSSIKNFQSPTIVMSKEDYDKFEREYIAKNKNVSLLDRILHFIFG